MISLYEELGFGLGIWLEVMNDPIPCRSVNGIVPTAALNCRLYAKGKKGYPREDWVLS